MTLQYKLARKIWIRGVRVPIIYEPSRTRLDYASRVELLEIDQLFETSANYILEKPEQLECSSRRESRRVVRPRPNIIRIERRVHDLFKYLYYRCLIVTEGGGGGAGADDAVSNMFRGLKVRRSSVVEAGEAH